MHAEAHAFVAATVRDRRLPRILEFGSRNINGSVRDMMCACDVYVGVDIADGPGVDVVADAAGWPEDTFDAVICCEVLEHTPAGPAMLAAAHRALIPGGLLVLTCATAPREPHSAHDGGHLPDGEHYANVSPADLTRWLSAAGFVSWQFDGHLGDLYCTATA